MIAASDLRKLARGRLRDAEALFEAGRYDAAAYICGYAVEIALKARICRTLHWDSFPETNADFDGLQSYRTHKLSILLRLSGKVRTILGKHLEDWDKIVSWNPEQRYLPIGSTSRETARQRLESAGIVTRAL